MSVLRQGVTIEGLNQVGRDTLPGALGLEIVELTENRLTARLSVKKLHLAPNNFLHAASIIALADTACGYATIAHLPDGADSFTTIELKTNFFSTVREGGIFCVATPQHLGRTTQVWDAVVTDEASGKKLALFRCTQMVLWPKK
jgi:uncharacterized protein (TIGR00369 family)